jgi:myo-inositol-1(or 4)-monophosphatase
VDSVGREEWNDFADFARTLAKIAGDAILPLFRTRSSIDNKSAEGFDPVTEADRAGERVMRRMIAERFPDHGIIGEEFAPKPARSRFQWVLDPVDGTRAFICGLPVWTTLIALTERSRPVLGLVSQPFIGETFIGGPFGSWSEHRSIQHRLNVRPAEVLKNAVLTTVAPELYRTARQRAVLDLMRARTRMIRYGGDAYFFALLAAGSIDIAIDANLKPYDIAALIPIIEGAGGIVSTWEGSDAAEGGDIIAAASPGLHAEALRLMHSLPEWDPGLR